MADTNRPLLLDLFCGVGGAAKGYHDAGFDVIGVDRYLQPNYPYSALVLHDAPATLRRLLTDPTETITPNHPITGKSKKRSYKLSDFTVIHASPPCQHYSITADQNGNRHLHPDLLPVVRDLLQQTGKPYIIENVMWSPLIKEQTILLCGVYFHESHNLRVIRHRLFESDVPLVAPPHMSRWEHPLCVTWNKRHNHYGKLDQWKDYVTVVGGGTCRFDAAKDAMQIPWARKKRELNEAIPPAYTEYVGKQLLQVAA